MRERLIELIKQGDKTFADKYAGEILSHIDELYDFIADHLLANGVIIPKCKVGDKVYLIDKRLLVWWKGEVIALYYAKSDGVRYAVALEGGDVLIYDDDEVFSTREEAEKALKGGEG